MWEPPIISLAWRILETLSHSRRQEKHATLKFSISKFFTLSNGTSTNPCFPMRRAYLFTLCNFYFCIWVSIFSYKSRSKEHHYHTCALDVVNIWVCCINGSMIEHDGVVITFFSVDILEDLVACWYAWVLKSSCQIIDYCFASSLNSYVQAEIKIIW